MSVPDNRTFRPACLLRLQVRLEDFSEAGDQVPTEAVPFDQRVKELAQIETNLTGALARARARGNQADASDLIKRIAKTRVQLDSYRASEPQARAIQEELGDVFSTSTLVVPIECSVELNSWRIADKATATIPFRDFPFDPQIVRAALMEVYMGTVPVESFATPDRWRLTLDRSNLMFRGYVDEPKFSHTGDDSTVTLEARSLEAILIDTKIHPLSHIYRPKGEGEPITQYINRILGSIPATAGRISGDQLKALMYRTQKEPVLSRKLLMRQLQTAKSRTDASGQVAGAPPPEEAGGTDPGQVAGEGQPRLTTEQPEDTSAWDLITKACILVGLVPTYDPALVPSPQTYLVNGTLKQSETVGDFLLLRPPQTLFDKVGGGISIDGGPQDGFSRDLPDPESPVKFVQPSQIRMLVWGKNIKEFNASRKLGRIKAPAVEVISYNPDAPPAQRALVARYPTTLRATRIGATGGGKVDEVVTRIVNGVRDQAQLQQIAVALHHSIARQELTCEIHTDDLSSYIDPTRPETNNENPDLLKLRHGTPVRVVVAREIDDPQQGNSLVITPLSELFERRTTELRRYLIEQNNRYRPDLDPDISQALVDEMVSRISRSIADARRVDLFYTRCVNHTWSSDEGWSAKIEVVNYMEPRSLPSALSTDDQKYDAVMRIPANGVKKPASHVARERARKSQGRQ